MIQSKFIVFIGNIDIFIIIPESVINITMVKIVNPMQEI